jgi:hypothetical protein
MAASGQGTQFTGRGSKHVIHDRLMHRLFNDSVPIIEVI